MVAAARVRAVAAAARVLAAARVRAVVAASRVRHRRCCTRSAT